MAAVILSFAAELISSPAQAQQQTASTIEPSFEVASVRISHETNGSASGGPGTRSPGVYKATGFTMRDLLARASGFQQRAQYESLISGPSWIDHDTYDVVAKVPPKTSRSELRQMLMNLLIERFKLVVHHESKQLSAYDLVVDKDGLKMKETSEDPSAEPGEGPPHKGFDKEGFPSIPAGRTGMVRTLRIVDEIPRAYWTARNSSISELVRSLAASQEIDELVIDKTGLTGRYDYTLGFEIEMQGAGLTNGPSVFEAVRQQLGLRLIHKKADMDVLVVERGNRVPVEN